MNYCTMQYKNYIWTHNPKNIEILSNRDVKENTLPYFGSVFQDYGRKKRIVKGIGEFFGSDCLSQYDTLFSLFKEGGEGFLFLPQIPPFLAIFKSLSLVGETTPNVVRYSFEFWECTDQKAKNTSLFNYHTVSENETLWDISYLYNVKIENLLNLNKNIKNPNDLAVGEKVRLF